MNAELFVDVTPDHLSLALTEDKRLVEHRKEKSNIQFAVGDVYLGRVKKIMPGLNAAFVDVGYENDAFLHYLDLGASPPLTVIPILLAVPATIFIPESTVKQFISGNLSAAMVRI